MTSPPELDWGDVNDPPADDGERWRPVSGQRGRYEVSDAGRVRSLVRLPRILVPSLSTKGYPRVKVGGSTSVEIHRLVMRAFAGPCPPGQEIRHLDGNPLNCCLGNLVYGTRSENTLDSVRHGTHVQARKTHCPADHPYDEDNTYRNPRTGERQCLECKRAANRIYMRGYYLRKREAS